MLRGMTYDVTIIGAGAAGLMTAIQAAPYAKQVLLLEGQNKIGAKILMSGGTRCNVTNRTVSEKDFNSERIINARNVLRSFSNQDTIEFFKDLGVELVLEPTGKYFPATHSGKTVLEALIRRVTSCKNITLLCAHKVKALSNENNIYKIKGDGFEFQSRRVVLTTGGLSYPGTGSDGTGYRLAQSFGHAMVDTSPALTPLKTEDKGLKSLSGVSLDVRLTLLVNGRRQVSFKDGFLFTHAGVSGPAALDISRHYERAQGDKKILVNFIPGHTEQSLQEHLIQVQRHAPRKTLKAVLIEFIPQRLAAIVLQKCGIDEGLVINQLEKKTRQELVNHCVQYPLDVSGVLGYSKAEVTAGGIDWQQVHPKTLESKLADGLYFAGEILDVDGRIGGFNFQWAWASGYVVAQALLKK